MRKILMACMIAATCLFGTSCATLSSWWNENHDAILDKAQLVLNGVEIFKGTAIATFEVVKTRLDPVDKDKAEEAFQKAMLSLSAAQAALANLMDAVDFETTNIDFLNIFKQIASAITHVQYIVDLYQNKIVGPEAFEREDGLFQMYNLQAEDLKAKLLEE